MVNRGMMVSLSYVPPCSIYNVSRWIHLVKYLVYFFYVSRSKHSVDALAASSGVFVFSPSPTGVAPFTIKKFIVFFGSAVSVIVSWHRCLQKSKVKCVLYIMYHVELSLSRKKFIYFLNLSKVQVLTPTLDEPDLSPRCVGVNQCRLIFQHLVVLGVVEELIEVRWCIASILATCFDVCL